MTRKHQLRQAIDLALAGQWDEAHKVVQAFEDDVDAAWIHAVLHKIEGDAGNSRYWYARAGQVNHFPDEPRTELAEIKRLLQDD